MRFATRTGLSALAAIVVTLGYSGIVTAQSAPSDQRRMQSINPVAKAVLEGAWVDLGNEQPIRPDQLKSALIRCNRQMVQFADKDLPMVEPDNWRDHVPNLLELKGDLAFFETDRARFVARRIHGTTYVREVYTAAMQDGGGNGFFAFRVTAPVDLGKAPTTFAEFVNGHERFAPWAFSQTPEGKTIVSIRYPLTSQGSDWYLNQNGTRINRTSNFVRCGDVEKVVADAQAQMQ